MWGWTALALDMSLRRNPLVNGRDPDWCTTPIGEARYASKDYTGLLKPKLHQWLEAQLAKRKTEPNSGLGKAISHVGSWPSRIERASGFNSGQKLPRPSPKDRATLLLTAH